MIYFFNLLQFNLKLKVFYTCLVTLIYTCVAFSQPYQVDMVHEKMEIKIGVPAIIEPQDKPPSFYFYSRADLLIQGSVRIIGGEYIEIFNSKSLKRFEKEKIQITNSELPNGTYRVDFKIIDHFNSEYHESFYFTVLRRRNVSKGHSLIVHPGKNGQLIYIPDYRGNRIPDYSTAGYQGGGIEIPDIPVNIRLNPKKGDDTERIQEAINLVSVNPSGGAVLLTKGVYEISGSIEIRHSGVVIKGEGQGDLRELLLDPAYSNTLDDLIERLQSVNATVLIATGEERRTLIKVYGESGPTKIVNVKGDIVDQYVPVGANSFRVDNSEMFSAGDRIVVQIGFNYEWISEIGMDQIPEIGGSRIVTQWAPFEIEFEHVIDEVKGDMIFLEGNIFTAIDRKWGGGSIYKYQDEVRIKEVGIENIRAISFWQKDEHGVDNTRHADRFINFTNTKNAWINNVTAEHFYSINGAISIGRGSSQITINECSALLAENDYYSGSMFIGNAHIGTSVYVGRYGFRIYGQNNLIINCFTLNNRHSFTISSRVPGANVFLNCKGEASLTWSGPHHKWSVGGLYDNVNENLAFMNRLNMGGGHGWAGANYLAWNTLGKLVCEQPPTAQNWAIGHGGRKEDGPFNYYGSEGYWEFTDFPLEPKSLYLKQLEDRLGEDALPGIDFSKFRSYIINDKDIILNYPNPARYYTYFEYKLKENMFIQLNVYSINGKLVSVVDQGYREEGPQNVYWELVDNNGNKLPIGFYIYQLIAGNNKYTNKLLIIR